MKSSDLTIFFAALIFLPRDSIGKFFPWEEFSNAWLWFDEIFPALIFLPWASIVKFFPWEEFSNASHFEVIWRNFWSKHQKILPPELFSISVWNGLFYLFFLQVCGMCGVYVLFQEDKYYLAWESAFPLWLPIPISPNQESWTFLWLCRY